MVDLNKICKRTDYILGRTFLYEGDIIEIQMGDSYYPCHERHLHCDHMINPFLYVMIVINNDDFALRVLNDCMSYHKGELLDMKFLLEFCFGQKVVDNVKANP